MWAEAANEVLALPLGPKPDRRGGSVDFAALRVLTNTGPSGFQNNHARIVSVRRLRDATEGTLESLQPYTLVSPLPDSLRDHFRTSAFLDCCHELNRRKEERGPVRLYQDFLFLLEKRL